MQLLFATGTTVGSMSRTAFCSLARDRRAGTTVPEPISNGYAHQSPFATENIYFLGLDSTGTPGLRMPSLETTGTGETVATTTGHAYLDDDRFVFADANQAESGLILVYDHVCSARDPQLLP